jgi:hypothetical protein
MSRTARLFALACVAALALGACGSSYKGLSKAEFAKQAVAICTKTETKLSKFGASFGSDPTIAQVKAAYKDQLIPVLNDEIDQLRALKPPKADRKTISKMLDDLTTGIGQASDKINSLTSTKQLESLDEPPALKAADKEAKAYGLGKCSDSST